MSFCACAKSRELLNVHCFIAVLLVDVDLPYWTSKVEHIVAFTATFSNICTAHAQKRLFMNFRCKFRHHRTIRQPRFPIRVQNFGDLATFSVDFYISYAEWPPYFYFRFVWPTDLESIPHASTPTSIVPTKFEVDMTIHCRVIASGMWWAVYRSHAGHGGHAPPSPVRSSHWNCRNPRRKIVHRVGVPDHLGQTNYA